MRGRSLSLIPGSIDNYVTGVNARSQRRDGRKDDEDAVGWPPVRGRSLSLIPGSIDNYVTGVNARSQRRDGRKDDED